MPRNIGNSIRVSAGPRPPDRCGILLGSLCGPKACRLCCQCCPPIQESTSTKSIYCLLLAISLSLMASMLAPSIQRDLQTVFRDFNATCIDLTVAAGNCMKLTGYMAVFKISFSITFFFLIMSCITLGVKSSKGARACIHNGFWFFKLLLIATIIVATFVIPISHTDTLHSGWIYATMVGNCLFIFLQTICLIKISDLMCKRLSFLASGSRLWRVVEIGMALSVLSLWLAMAIVIFISHGRQEYCLTKHLIIIFNAGFCIALVLAALTPCARTPTRKNMYLPGPPISNHSTYGVRLLQSGLMIVYVTFWIWSAMQSSPENPGIIEMSTFLTEEDADDAMTCRHYNSRLAENGLLLAACFMMLLTVVYVCSDFHIISKGKRKKNRHGGRTQNLFGPAGLSGADLHRQDRVERIGLHNISGINSSSSISFNESSTTTTTRAIKNSASEEGEPGLCVCLQNEGASYHPEESEVEPSNFDPFVRHQPLKSSSCNHNKTNTSFSGNGMTASNAAAELNTYGIRQGTTNRNNFDLQMEEIINKTDNDAGQSVVRNEIRHTTYSYSFFHLTLALATTFMTTQFTRWFHPKKLGEIIDRQEILSDRNWSTVGVKIACGWFCGIIYLVYLLIPDKKGKFCFSESVCCCGHSNRFHLNRHRPQATTSLSSPSLTRTTQPSTCCGCFTSNPLSPVTLNLSSNGKCSKCISAEEGCCASILSALSCCCLRIRRKSMLGRGGIRVERTNHLHRAKDVRGAEKAGFMAECNNMLVINTPFPRSSLAEEEQDQISSEAANTDMTTVSPTPPPPPIPPRQTSNFQESYATMLLPAPSRSIPDFFDHQYPAVQVNGEMEKNTFGTLPLHNLDTCFRNRYTYENATQTTKTRIVFMESSPQNAPPKLSRQTLPTTNSSNTHFTSSYM